MQLQQKDTEEFGRCNILSVIELSLLPLRVCLESNLLVASLQLLRDMNGVDNSRTEHSRIQLPSRIRDLPTYLEWTRHHAEQSLRVRNPPTVRSTKPMRPLSHRQLYEESKHTRIQSIRITPVVVSLSLALGSQFVSYDYNYFTIQDFQLSFPRFSIDERYPRRISYVSSQLFSSYRTTLFLNLLFAASKSHTLGNPYRLVSSYFKNLQKLGDELFSLFPTRSLLSSVRRFFSSFTDYIDNNLVNLSLSAIDIAMGITSWTCMLFQQLHAWVAPHLLYGEITPQSPYLKIKNRYTFLSRLWRQGSMALWCIAGTISSISSPLQLVLRHLQALRSSLDREEVVTKRAKPPNVSIGGIIMVSI